MSSILVGELKELLNLCPDDYEVIFQINEVDPDGDKLISYAYINGFKVNDDFEELLLMN